MQLVNPFKKLSLQKHGAEQTHETEAYVSSPPALWIVEGKNNVWMLGLNQPPVDVGPRGEFCFDVLRNGKFMGEFASRIEMRGNRLRIFTRDGWKRWTGVCFV